MDSPSPIGVGAERVSPGSSAICLSLVVITSEIACVSASGKRGSRNISTRSSLTPIPLVRFRSNSY